MPSDVRFSPLDSEHRRLDARMTPFGGWEMPLNYRQGTIHEHLACRRDAVMFDVSHLGTVRVPDGFDALQRTLTNDLGRIGPGRAQYTHLLADDGSVLDDIIVWWRSDGIFDVMPNASNTDRVVNAIGGHDVTADRAVIAVQGPGWAERVKECFQPAASVARFRVAEIEWRGVACVVAGTGYTGEPGIEIAVPAEAASDLWRALLESGIEPAGLGARDTLRLEAGLPLHGHELGPGITSLQAGLGWVVAWDKPDFRGREAVRAERSVGPHRHLVGIATEGRRPPREGSAILVDGSKVGETTSGNFSPVLEHGIALGFVTPEVVDHHRVSIEVRGSLLEGVVTPLPFVKR